MRGRENVLISQTSLRRCFSSQERVAAQLGTAKQENCLQFREVAARGHVVPFLKLLGRAPLTLVLALLIR